MEIQPNLSVWFSFLVSLLDICRSKSFSVHRIVWANLVWLARDCVVSLLVARISCTNGIRRRMVDVSSSSGPLCHSSRTAWNPILHFSESLRVGGICSGCQQYVERNLCPCGIPPDRVFSLRPFGRMSSVATGRGRRLSQCAAHRWRLRCARANLWYQAIRRWFWLHDALWCHSLSAFSSRKSSFVRIDRSNRERRCVRRTTEYESIFGRHDFSPYEWLPLDRLICP